MQTVSTDDLSADPAWLSCALAEATVGPGAPSGAGDEGIWTSGDASSSTRSHDSFLIPAPQEKAPDSFRIAARWPRTFPQSGRHQGTRPGGRCPSLQRARGPDLASPPHSGGARAQQDGGKARVILRGQLSPPAAQPAEASVLHWPLPLARAFSPERGPHTRGPRLMRILDAHFTVRSS